MSEDKPDYTTLRPGDAYVEEVDPELHEANQAAHRVAKLALAYRRSEKKAVMFAWLDLKGALDEYERLTGGEGG